MVRLGLCCTFLETPIKFRTTTVRHASALDRDHRTAFLNQIALDNVQALRAAISGLTRTGRQMTHHTIAVSRPMESASAGTT